MKKYLSKILVLTVALAFIPSLAFASWWNPFTWKIFNRPQKAPAAVVATTTAPISDQSAEIEKLKKEVETLKKSPAQPSKLKQQPQEKPASIKPSEQHIQQISAKEPDALQQAIADAITQTQQRFDVRNQYVQEIENYISVVQSKIYQYAGDASIRESGQAVIDEYRNLESIAKKLVELETDTMNKLTAHIGSNVASSTIEEEITQIIKQRDDYAVQVHASNSRISFLMKNLDRDIRIRNEILAQPTYTYTPPPTVIYQQPSPAPQTTNPQIESALSDLRTKLDGIQHQAGVTRSYVNGEMQSAIRNWMQQNPNAFSSSGYINQFNSIVVSYGFSYMAIPQ